MTFETEDLRTQFHSLPTQFQYEWNAIDEYMMEQGKFIHVTGIGKAPEANDHFLEIVVRVRTKNEDFFSIP